MFLVAVEVFTSGITFLIDEDAKNSRRSQSASQKIIKKNYNAPEVKSAPEEKDKHKLYFPESQVGPARKVTEQISINKGDAFLI
jgi:hypothetical protein